MMKEFYFRYLNLPVDIDALPELLYHNMRSFISSATCPEAAILNLAV